MKGGGLTWIGWGALGVGAMLMYAGMTGASLLDEFGRVLGGTGSAKPAAPSTSPSSASPAPAPSQGVAVGEPAPPSASTVARQLAAERALPWPSV